MHSSNFLFSIYNLRYYKSFSKIAFLFYYISPLFLFHRQFLILFKLCCCVYLLIIRLWTWALCILWNLYEVLYLFKKSVVIKTKCKINLLLRLRKIINLLLNVIIIQKNLFRNWNYIWLIVILLLLLIHWRNHQDFFLIYDVIY